MSSSLSGLAAKGGRKSGGRRAGGLSKGAGQADKENTLGGDTYAFDDAEANGESPCADSKLQLADEGFGSSRKRSSLDFDEECEGNGVELQTLLGAIGTDIRKRMDGKRKKVEALTQTTVAANSKRSLDLFQRQQGERQRIIDEFLSKASQIQQKWHGENQKMKEEEERFYETVKQHERDLQRHRVAQAEAAKLLKQMHEQFKKGLEELEQVHQQQHSSVQNENKKDMALLQKRLLMETQNQGINNVRQSLQSMLAQV